MSHPKGNNIARAEAYRSFARLFLSEPDSAFLEALKGAERFEGILSSDPHDLRIEYTRLFTLNVFPYASVFLDPEAFLNTETTARVQAAYEQAGFEPPLSPDMAIGAPDHFGVELVFVAHLLEFGGELSANQFLAAEVLPWAVIFLHAVEQNAREAFYRVAAQEVGAALMNDLRVPAQTTHLGPPSSLLTGEDDLDTVVTRLLAPAQSGFFMSKDDISSIARALAMPVGFGDRGLMLRNLFRAAGEYGRVDNLIHALGELTETWIGYLTLQSRAHPNLVPVLEAWMKRATSTRERLEEMSRIARWRE